MTKNILIRLGIAVEHFSESERTAQAKAQAITNQAKALLASSAALTLEMVFPEAGAAAPAVNAIVNKLCTVLASPVIANDLDMISTMLGHYGALLTAEFDGHKHDTLGDYIIIFESLFNS